MNIPLPTTTVPRPPLAAPGYRSPSGLFPLNPGNAGGAALPAMAGGSIDYASLPPIVQRLIGGPGGGPIGLRPVPVRMPPIHPPDKLPLPTLPPSPVISPGLRVPPTVRTMSAASLEPGPMGPPAGGLGTGGFGTQPGPRGTPNIAVWGGGPNSGGTNDGIDWSRVSGGRPDYSGRGGGAGFNFVSPLGTGYTFNAPSGYWMNSEGYPRAVAVNPSQDPYGLSGGSWGTPLMQAMGSYGSGGGTTWLLPGVGEALMKGI